MTDLQACPCGLTGLNCTEFVEGIEDINQTVEGFCFEEGFRECLVIGNEARCGCNCGWTGGLCDEQFIPLIGNYCKASLF